ncbi:MAG: hypothetical protein AB7G06_05565 [Bdellovibrionales bacterium]
MSGTSNLTAAEQHVTDFVQKLSAFCNYDVIVAEWGADGPRDLRSPGFKADIARSMSAAGRPADFTDRVYEFATTDPEIIVELARLPLPALLPVYHNNDVIDYKREGELVTTVVANVAFSNIAHVNMQLPPEKKTVLAIAHEAMHRFTRDEHTCDIGGALLVKHLLPDNEMDDNLAKLITWRRRCQETEDATENDDEYQNCAPLLQVLRHHIDWMSTIPWRDLDHIAAASHAFATAAMELQRDIGKVEEHTLRAALRPFVPEHMHSQWDADTALAQMYAERNAQASLSIIQRLKNPDKGPA